MPDGAPRVGGWCGLGGAIYALARCGALLDDRALVVRGGELVEAAPARARRGTWSPGSPGSSSARRCSVRRRAPRPARCAPRGRPGSTPPPLLDGGAPACAPDPATGVAVALARAAARLGDPALAVPPPAGGALAWRLSVDPAAADEAARRVADGGGDPLDQIDLALAGLRATGRA